jgi:hypothetical protein
MVFPSMYIGLCDVSATEWYSFGDPEVKAIQKSRRFGNRQLQVADEWREKHTKKIMMVTVPRLFPVCFKP